MIPELIRPALRRGTRVMWRKDGSLAAGRSLRFVNFRGIAAPIVYWILENADGSRHFPEIFTALSLNFPEYTHEELQSVWQQVLESGVLYDAQESANSYLDETSRERFDRQIAFWVRYEKQGGPDRIEMQSRLQKSTVLQIGLGGLGSWIAFGLVSSGIQHLIGVDPDNVSLSNLNRQILYTKDDVGHSKIEAAGKRLVAYYPELKFDAYAELAVDQAQITKWLDGVDFAVLAADHPAGYLRRWFAAACHSRGIPYLMIGGSLLGPFVIPGETACFGCYEQHLRSADPDYDTFIDQLARARPEHSSVAFNHSIMGGFIVREMVMHLSGAAEPLSRNAVIRLDLENIQSTQMKLTRTDDCPICGIK